MQLVLVVEVLEGLQHRQGRRGVLEVGDSHRVQDLDAGPARAGVLLDSGGSGGGVGAFDRDQGGLDQ